MVVVSKSSLVEEVIFSFPAAQIAMRFASFKVALVRAWTEIWFLRRSVTFYLFTPFLTCLCPFRYRQSNQIKTGQLRFLGWKLSKLYKIYATQSLKLSNLYYLVPRFTRIDHVGEAWQRQKHLLQQHFLSNAKKSYFQKRFSWFSCWNYHSKAW